jgi:hypothetical protein
MIEDTKEFEIYEAKNEINENWYDEQFEPDSDEQYGCWEVDDPSFYGSEW